MEIRENDDLCIFAPLSTKMDSYESSRLFREIEKENRKSAIDMTYVTDCTIDFIEKINEFCGKKKISIFNISSDIFALFNVMKTDRYANLYVSELDFAEQTRQLVNRKFSVV